MGLPLVIAHRGACAYRPENTLEAFALGIAQGADGIEFDLVTTRDQRLIVRHENTLRGTTNVASQEKFAELKRIGFSHGKEISDWFTEDFTLAELKQLKAVERLPELRPGSATFDAQFEIPTLEEVLQSNFIVNQVLVIELKDGTHLDQCRTVGNLVADQLKVSEASCSYVIESFDLGILLDVKEQLANFPASYLYALENTSIEHVDLYYLAQNFQGLTISLEMLFAEEWVTSCHEVGLQVWAYTARAEDAQTSIDEYYERIIETGVDAIFADHPDLLRRVLSDRA